ncbi:hypothetical protein CAEBREN_02644 [Caenorhabditis brenneri]|uniref:Saposin B-type domain-containing protein n=1 Tax=Caenorhabditis brenneri TaxID=135651 RepID=G0PKX9_CAEBE|nr:hypothetical protein CAEBREN_02644 [Caenorhabditis brenneri]
MNFRLLIILLSVFYIVQCSKIITKNNPTDPQLSPVCTNCLDGVISVKNTIQKIANFAKITIGTTIDKVCDHIVPEFDFLEAICHVIDQNIEDKVYKFIMAIHDKINERFLCYILSFCPK